MTTLSQLPTSTFNGDQNSQRQSQVLEWEQTSLKRIPRGWPRIRHEFAIFLKSIGLGIITATYQGTFEESFSEPKKVTIRCSRTSSFFTSLIHVLPVGIALYEVILNLRGHYVGEYFTRQAYYQLAAKAHEILIDASLTSIVLSYIRHELTNGDGLPFGAFLGGLQFLSVSYLWSRELWSSVLTKAYDLRKRVMFLVFMVTCGIIAATAGPSSATLLIPRELRWGVQPSYVLLNGTSQDIWPDRLSPLQIPEYCEYFNSSASVDPICPGSDWKAIQNELKQITQYYGSALNHLTAQQTVSTDQYFFEIPGYQQTVKNGDVGICVTSGVNLQVCGAVVPTIVKIAAFNDTVTWQNIPGFETYTNIYHTIDQNFNQAYSAIQCAQDTIAVQGSEDSVSLRFPRLALNEQEYQNPPKLIPLSNLTNAAIYSLPGNISEFRMLWTDLPQYLFGNKMSGVVVLNPRSSLSNSPQNITTCTFSAGWGTSTASTDLEYLNDLFARPTDLPSAIASVTHLQRNKVREIVGEDGQFHYIFANVSGSSFPQRSLEMPLAWLGYLNPTISLESGVNTTAFNAYMTSLPEGASEAVVSTVVMYMLLLGISTQGIRIPWQTLLDGPISCIDCEIIRTNHAYEGFAYRSDATPVLLAIIVMMIYCTLAFAHIVYLLTTGLSSDAWDSVAEIFVLAMNSSPSRYLENTCSGIIGMKPFRTSVRIVATASEAGATEDHLELKFGDKSEAKVPEIRMQVGREYGTLPRKLHYD